MPMPHRVQMQVIKRRLVGKEGSERIRELRRILDDLPGYRSGPYADIRKWVNAQLEETRTRSRVVHRDSIAVRREGAAQIAFVGPPNAGKSSLLQALSNIQIKTGDYAFTTTRPVPALTRIRGVLVQLVEIPGLIAGAVRRPRRRPRAARRAPRRRSDRLLPGLLGTGPASSRPSWPKCARPGSSGRRSSRPRRWTRPRRRRCDGLDRLGLEVVPVSVLDDQSLESFRRAVWRLTGLIRVFLRKHGEDVSEAVALRPPASVADAARSVHHQLEERCVGAHVWGPSARFDGQRVGREHELADDDVVEIVSAR